MKVLSFGEVVWDIYESENHIGGAPLNFAAHVAKNGEEAYLLSSVGNDELGADAISVLKALGVHDEYVKISDNAETGKCLVVLNDEHIPTYTLTDNTAYDRISTDTVPDSFDVLYFGTLAMRGEYNRRSLQKLIDTHGFSLKFSDINIRAPFYSAEQIEFCLANADILKISLEELPLVAESLGIGVLPDHTAYAEYLARRRKNLKCIIITLGGAGAYALDCDTMTGYFRGAEKVHVASTVGAGDSFSAGFLTKYLHGCDIPSCLDYAARIAGFVVSHLEAVPDYSAKLFS